VNGILQTFLVLGILLYFFILLFLIKRRTLLLKYTLLWIFSGIIMLIVAVFPKIMISITHFLGVVEVTNGVFALILFFMLIILMSITSIVSNMKEKNKQLIQKCALFEKRIRELEEIIKN